MEFAGVIVLGELAFIVGKAFAFIVTAVTVLMELEREKPITTKNNTMPKNVRKNVELLDFIIICYLERETLRNKVIG